MKRIGLNLNLLVTMTLILTLLLIGCSAKMPEARLMPLAKIQVPPAPHLEQTNLGLIPLKSGGKVLYPNGNKHFIVPKTGGVFFPKLTAENVELNNKLWTWYSASVTDSVNKYNGAIEAHNDRLANIKIDSKKPWYKKLW